MMYMWWVSYFKGLSLILKANDKGKELGRIKISAPPWSSEFSIYSKMISMGIVSCSISNLGRFTPPYGKWQSPPHSTPLRIINLEHTASMHSTLQLRTPGCKQSCSVTVLSGWDYGYWLYNSLIRQNSTGYTESSPELKKLWLLPLNFTVIFFQWKRTSPEQYPTLVHVKLGTKAQGSYSQVLLFSICWTISRATK